LFHGALCLVALADPCQRVAEPDPARRVLLVERAGLAIRDAGAAARLAGGVGARGR
jgi:hypothetical protein